MKSIELPVVVGKSPTLGIRGLLAARKIKKGELIERCNLILYPITDEKKVDETIFGSYVFEWSKEFDCLPVGYCLFCNHSTSPNVRYTQDYKRKLQNFWALREIEEGEELLVNYNGYSVHAAEPVADYYVNYDQGLPKKAYVLENK